MNCFLPCSFPICWLCASFLLLGLTSCGSRVPLGQVQGTITSGGKPLAGVLVTFLPESNGAAAAEHSNATTDDQGHYRLQTAGGQAGAILGQHKVIVEDLAIHSAPRSPDGTVLKMPPVRFSPTYSNSLQTPLSSEVKPGEQTLDWNLAEDS